MHEILRVFKAGSDRNRLRVIAALTSRQELCACQITELLGVSGATASRHMDVLIAADLIVSEKRGRWVYYKLKREGSCPAPVLEWLQSAFQQDSDVQADLERLIEITACEPRELCRRQRAG